MSGILHATGLDVVTTTEGEVYIRLYREGVIIAVAGMTAETALAAAERLTTNVNLALEFRAVAATGAIH